MATLYTAINYQEIPKILTEIQPFIRTIKFSELLRRMNRANSLELLKIDKLDLMKSTAFKTTIANIAREYVDITRTHNLLVSYHDYYKHDYYKELVKFSEGKNCQHISLYLEDLIETVKLKKLNSYQQKAIRIVYYALLVINNYALPKESFFDILFELNKPEDVPFIYLILKRYRIIEAGDIFSTKEIGYMFFALLKKELYSRPLLKVVA